MGRDTAEDWKWGVESICNLTETAEEDGVTLVIEPLNRYESCIVSTAEDALRFRRRVYHQCPGCYDQMGQYSPRCRTHHC